MRTFIFILSISMLVLPLLARAFLVPVSERVVVTPVTPSAAWHVRAVRRMRRVEIAMNRRSSRKRQGGTLEKGPYIEVAHSGEYWRLEQAAEVLRKGGVGIIPTDTCYTFACDVHSRRGVERIFELKNVQGQKKPLSLLCKDLSTISKYAYGIDKGLFKIFKATLPGPFTFILPATHEVPRVLLEHKHHKKSWKRREIGVRMPDNDVLLELLGRLDGPLLCSSVPASTEEETPWLEEDESDTGEDDPIPGGAATDPSSVEATWGHAVDVVVDAGVLQAGGVSTVVDVMGAEPVVLRRGLGEPSDLQT